MEINDETLEEWGALHVGAEQDIVSTKPSMSNDCETLEEWHTIYKEQDVAFTQPFVRSDREEWHAIRAEQDKAYNEADCEKVYTMLLLLPCLLSVKTYIQVKYCIELFHMYRLG